MNNLIDMDCRYCGFKIACVKPHEIHGREARCHSCGKHLKWLGKDDGNGYRRPSSHRKLVKKAGLDYCQICLKKRDELPKGRTLEGHHLEEFKDGGGAVDEGNIIVTCTACHRLIHWIRTYH